MNDLEKRQHVVSQETFDEWEKEWKDMPEFVQEKQEPFATIKIRYSFE